jgi:hypothetical protein
MRRFRLTELDRARYRGDFLARLGPDSPSKPLLTRVLPALPIVLATALLAQRCIHAVLVKVGHPGATLDDSFIHFQYARAIAEGHPLRYQAGEPITTGATSILWPALLAPFYLVGFRDLAVMWPAWALSFAAHGMLAWEAYQLAHPLTGKQGGWAAAAMVLAFAGFAWCSSSGMEVMPFAWAMARATRLASEWSERREARTPKALRDLVLMAWVAALFRPEGAITAMLVAITIAAFPREKSLRSRASGLFALAGALATPLLLLALTGSTRSNTTVVKLMVGSPYFQGAVLQQAVVANVRLLVGTLLNGEVWSNEFLPTGSAVFALMGLVALLVVGFQTDKRWRSLLVLALALGMFIPCLYVTFLWNRLRYLWPFATGFFIGLSCLARVVTDLAASVWPRARSFAPVIAGAFVGALAVRLDWTIDDVANSAHGIDQQHVKIGRWAKANLPSDARIAVNDTGAIAYFSDRHTFDIVGLTSEGEAKYWVAGGGSRMEHYERLKATAPNKLPTHFIVYPEWMGTDALFGKYLYDATVTDSTILGGQSMRAYEADYSLLGSGEAPWSEGIVVDSVDVADLESEAAHAYDLLGARDNQETVNKSLSEVGTMTLDGARILRHADRFTLDFSGASRLIMRVCRTALSTDTPWDSPIMSVTLDVLADGAVVGSVTFEGGEWVEKSVPISTNAKTRLEVRSRDGSLFTSFHYWSVR